MRPNRDWPAILALHGHALYSEIELRELFKIYSQKGAGENFDEFISSRFVRHPFFSDAKYLWQLDYNKVMQKLNSQQAAEDVSVAYLADKKVKAT